MNNLPDTACKQERFEQGFGTLLRWQCQSPGAPVGQSSNFFPGILLTICFRLTENELKKKNTAGKNGDASYNFSGVWLCSFLHTRHKWISLGILIRILEEIYNQKRYF